MQYKFKHILTAALMLIVLAAVCCYSVAAVPSDNPGYPDSSAEDESTIDDNSQYPDNPSSEYIPDTSSEETSSYEDNNSYYEEPPIESNYYFGDNGSSENYGGAYEDTSSYNGEQGTPGTNSLPEEDTDLYEANDTISTSTLNPEDWEIALNFDKTGNDNGDFSYIKNNKTGRDNNKNIWMLFVGIALIVGAVIILFVLTVSYKNKKKKAAAFAGTRGAIQRPAKHAQQPAPVRNKRVRINHKNDTAEIHLPQNMKQKRRKK